jgi:hypothetical protein
MDWTVPIKAVRGLSLERHPSSSVVIYQQPLNHSEDDVAVEEREFGNLIGSDKVEVPLSMAQTDQRLAR